MPHTQRRILRSALAGLVGVLVLGAAGAANADSGDFLDNLKIELGVMGGVHLFANDLELGVADAPGLTTPKDSGLVGLRLGFVLNPLFTLELEGREPVVLKAGHAFVEPPGVKMTGYNRSSRDALRLVIFYVSEPGTPFLDPLN